MIGRDLMNYYRTNLVLQENHHWNLEYFDNQYPYERDLYVGLLVIQMKEQEKAMQDAATQLG